MKEAYRSLPRVQFKRGVSLSFEPQMRWSDGKGIMRWFPLNRAGYWHDPNSYSTGVVVAGDAMSFRESRAVIARAKIAMGDGRLVWGI